MMVLTGFILDEILAGAVGWRLSDDWPDARS
jgi:hypothetical protein